MMELAGEPLIYRILERVKRCKLLHEIVLAIPDNEEDRVLRVVGESCGVTVFAGSEYDVLDRFYQAALNAEASIVVRLPADNATPEPEEIDKIIRHHIAMNRVGFSSNLSQIQNSKYPDGIGAEVFDFCILKEVAFKNFNQMQREHIHLNFYDYSMGKPVDPNWCYVSTIMCPVEFQRPDLILDINTVEQYNFMRKLYEYLYPKNPNFHITDTINWYDNYYKKTSYQKLSIK
jgi:spore coat polysaccharide biosynthesis protein SpsF